MTSMAEEQRPQRPEEIEEVVIDCVAIFTRKVKGANCIEKRISFAAVLKGVKRDL